MAEDDGEIEYLEEDEDIVQQCVQTVEEKPVPRAPVNVPLLVERRPVGRPRKRRKVEEDSDYEPSKYLPAKNKKRKTQKITRNTSLKTHKYVTYGQQGQSKLEAKGYGPRKYKKKTQFLKDDLAPRKQMDIRIPDYDDPLCLPVRAIKRDEIDTRNLRNWNNLCLENFENHDIVLKPDKGETVSSKRTVVIKKVANKHTGKPETSMWSKTSVQNQFGDKKSEVVQCTLPKYREKKMLNSFSLYEPRRRRSFHHESEVILTKEDQKDGETLIVYKPKETLSLVYKMFEKLDDGGTEDDDEQKRYMKEVASCRVCAPCYQVSWRGFRKNDQKIKCQICSRVCVSVYNLLSHLKSHSVEEMNKHKRLISKTLAGMVEYHYKCRICQEQFPGIKQLRTHVLSHRGTETFICDIGSHVAT
ncbi:zinc finger protein 652-like [Battus philenor]|uniref:zinc finger protein 652-like n=1 Tax=Battus philenor TaxID=42288 RepID=UPI0035D05886